MLCAVLSESSSDSDTHESIQAPTAVILSVNLSVFAHFMLYAALKLRVIFGKNRSAAVKYSAICGDILPNTAYILSLDSSGAYALNISKTHSSISVFAAEYITDSSVNALPEGSMNSAVSPRCENSGEHDKAKPRRKIEQRNGWVQLAKLHNNTPCQMSAPFFKVYANTILSPSLSLYSEHERLGLSPFTE